MAEQLSGSLLRCEQGSIDEYIAAPRNSAPAASAFFTASCSAWCVGEVSCVCPAKHAPERVTTTAPTRYEVALGTHLRLSSMACRRYSSSRAVSPRRNS